MQNETNPKTMIKADTIVENAPDKDPETEEEENIGDAPMRPTLYQVEIAGKQFTFTEEQLKNIQTMSESLMPSNVPATFDEGTEKEQKGHLINALGMPIEPFPCADLAALINAAPVPFLNDTTAVGVNKLDRRWPTVATSKKVEEEILICKPGSTFVASERWRLVGMRQLTEEWIAKGKNKTSCYATIVKEILDFWKATIASFDKRFSPYVKQPNFQRMAWMRSKPGRRGKGKRSHREDPPKDFPGEPLQVLHYDERVKQLISSSVEVGAEETAGAWKTNESDASTVSPIAVKEGQ